LVVHEEVTRLFQIEAAIYSDKPRTPRKQRRINLMWWREKFASERAVSPTGASAENMTPSLSADKSVEYPALAPGVRPTNPDEGRTAESQF
jgi:hypothetical protein